MTIQNNATKPTDPQALVLEAWAQGFMVGGLIIMSCVVVANMRKGVILHKVIFCELILGLWQGFSILFEDPVFAWWLSVAAIFLNMSWSLHNLVAWMKLRFFLSRRASIFFLSTLLVAQGYWVLEIYANFAFFHNVNDIFLKTRPLESLFRDPWWVYGALFLPYTIVTKYNMTFQRIVIISPRFGVMMVAMVLSIVFTIVDILSVTGVLRSALPVGINPFWKLAFVFKCLTDVVILDDFKSALDRITEIHQKELSPIARVEEDVHASSRERYRSGTSQRRWYGGSVDESKASSDELELVGVQKSDELQSEVLEKP